MNWKFWQRKDSDDKTVIEVKAAEGGVVSIYVANSKSERALEIFDELNKKVKKK